jgi:beta-mannosidase
VRVPTSASAPTAVIGFELTGTAGPPPADDAAWIPAPVPGGVHEALVDAGVIEHPYIAQHEADVAWVEQRTWWFRTTLPALYASDGVSTVLRFDGLDGVATVWLDDVELGTHANQHRPAEFDITPLVTHGSQRLLVRFVPPLEGLLQPGELEEHLLALQERMRRLRPLAELPAPEHLALRLQRTRRRKAACSWGWDLGPRIPSIGLHGPVLLLRRSGPTITGLHARTTDLRPEPAAATLRVVTTTDHGGAVEDSSLQLELADAAGTVVATWSGDASATTTAVLHVPQAQLWWTHDLGDQPLYTLTARLVQQGELLLERTERLGLRTIELDRCDDPGEPGRLFRFVLNGVPIFARGANWVPASLLVGSVPEQRHRELVTLARDANMTMLRVWGGGVYEQDDFYAACDELGLLVWQDFMFACDDYPSDDPALTEEVRAEAVHQVQRLRNHPSIALWAGNNEVQGIHEIVTGDLAPGGWGWSWFHELLPAVVAEHSPGALYWPGSPWGDDPDESVNGVHDGDRHAWEVWHGVDVGAGTHEAYTSHGQAVHFRRYAYDTGRFISEFGIHAAPDLQTLQRWTQEDPLALGSPALEHRNKDTPKDKGWAMMEVETGLPSTLDEYVDRTMACQAEGLKFAVEHYRRRQPHCSGALVWQLNDVWPGMSWSVLDYDLVGKAGYYFLQRAYAPVLASLRQHDGHVELWITNSRHVPIELSLQVAVGTLESHAVNVPVPCTAPAYSSLPVWSRPLSPNDVLARVSEKHGKAPPNRTFFRSLKELPLTGRVQGRATHTGRGSAQVVLRATGYSYLSRVHADAPGVRFSANYLDLADGEHAAVHITGLPDHYDLGRLRVASYGQPPAHVGLT